MTLNLLFKDREHLTLLFITILGLLLRVLFLDKFPVGFHSQEAIVGYRAFSIATTARDELGRFLPILFTSFQDFQLPFATYLLIPFIKLFRLNEFFTRLPFVILGVLSILAIYGICRKIFPEKQSIALWSAFFLAVNPWAVFLSRTTSDIVLSFNLFLLGLWVMLYSNKKTWLFGIAFLFLLTSLYSSKVSWFFVPTFLVILLFTKVSKAFFVSPFKLKLTFFVALVFLWLPLLTNYLSQSSIKQSLLLNDFSFFSDISTVNHINQMRGENISVGTPLLGQIFYNKSFYLIRIFENFLIHFNPRFLFAAGSGQPLLGLTNFGPVFLIFLPATVLGIILLLRKNDSRLFLLLIWTVLAIFPSTLFLPTLNQERLIFLLPVVAFIASIGMSNLKSRWILNLFFVGLIFNFAFVTYDAVVKEPKRVQKVWLHGYKDVAYFLAKEASNYDKVFVTDQYPQDPGPLLLFYFKTPPEKLWNSYLASPHFEFKNWIQRIENIQIGKIPIFSVKRDEKILFVATGKEVKDLTNYKIIKTITDLNGDPLLQIGRFIRFDER